VGAVIGTLSIIQKLVWIAVGVGILVGGYFLVTQGPQKVTQTVIQSVGLNNFLSGANLKSLSGDKQSCVKGAIGEARWDAITSGQAQPSQDDFDKASKCLNIFGK